jgi:GDP-D-mannose dehydratase
MWSMLQCPQPEDFVVASGIAHSLEEFVATASRWGSIGETTLIMILL